MKSFCLIFNSHGHIFLWEDFVIFKKYLLPVKYFFSLTSLPIITLINAMNPGWNEAVHFCVNVWRLWLQNWLQESPKKLRLHHQPLGTYSIKHDTDIQSHLIYLSNYCIYTNIPNIFENQWKTRSARTPTFWEYPRRLMITHTIDSYRIPSQKMTKSKLQN